MSGVKGQSQPTAASIGAEPVDADLTAIAALSTTAYGRNLLTLANQAALQSAVGSSGGPTSTPVVIAPNQATPADITGWTRENDPRLAAAGSTTDANGKITVNGEALPAANYLDYGGVANAPGYYRIVDANGCYKMVGRLGMTNPGQVGDKGVVLGVYSDVGTPFASFWLSNQGLGAYRMRFVYNNNQINSSGTNDVTEAVANAGVWVRLTITAQRVLLAEMCFTDTTVEPTTGWIEVYSTYNLDSLSARPNTWIERFHVYSTVGTANGPVGTLEGARTSVVPF